MSKADDSALSNPAGPSGVLSTGAWMAAGASVGLFGLGLWSVVAGAEVPMPLSIALLLIGFLGTVLAWFTLRLGRIAWAFSISLHGTLAVVGVFASPRLRDLIADSLPLSSNLAFGLVPAFALGLITVLLVLGADDIAR